MGCGKAARQSSVTGDGESEFIIDDGRGDHHHGAEKAVGRMISNLR